MHEYDLIADWYAADRKTDVGVPEVTALVRSLPPGAKVLDVGCGTGVPLTQTLLQAGCDVVGVDSSTRIGVPFRYFSFSVEGYRSLLARHELTLIDVHSDRWDNIYYLARRTAPRGP